MASKKRKSSSQGLHEPTSKRIDTGLRNAFDNMRLKRIVKENHGHDITQLAFFFNSKNEDVIDTSNVLGSVGGCEVYKVVCNNDLSKH